MIRETLDGLTANGDDGNQAVEANVPRAREGADGSVPDLRIGVGA